MRLFTWILVIIVLFIGISFAILNATPVSIHYYFGVTQLALSLLLVIALIIGAILGLIAGMMMLLRAKAVQRRLQKQLLLAEKEVKNLRRVPLEDK